MQPDELLLTGRTGRWQLPWAVAGTALTFILIIAFGLVTDPLERLVAAAYGVRSAGTDLLPDRLDTFFVFITFSMALAAAPLLVVLALHRHGARFLLGSEGRFRWDDMSRAALAMLVVMAAGVLVGLVREPQQYAWLERSMAHAPWLLLLLPVVLLQSFSEEVLFKGYLVRIWGAVLPWRLPVMLGIAGLFTAGHAVNDDVAQDIVFNLLYFLAGELLTLAVFFRTGSLGAVTGLHWINNVWAMGMLATVPGQSTAMALAAYTDPIVSAGQSRLLNPYSYLEIAVGLALLWLLLTWERSPLRVSIRQRDPMQG
jgi:membrane protease YdiL (CAAX protease family)